VVRPKKTTLLRQPTLPMVVMIEGPPLFGAWCQRGSELTIWPCGECLSYLISPLVYLSILGCGHVRTICVVWCMVMWWT
jgi:hypothetical protein